MHSAKGDYCNMNDKKKIPNEPYLPLPSAQQETDGVEINNEVRTKRKEGRLRRE